MAEDLSVTTDQYNYTPGQTAVFTASNVTLGGAVEFSVSHVNAGADGIYGTADDLYTYDLTGTGTPWSVTDGSDGDEDGLLNGIVSTSWFVNPDALNQMFVVSATDTESGLTATKHFVDAVPSDADVNLAISVTTISFGGAIWSNLNLGSGTGNIDPFVQIQENGTESGVNTDLKGENDEKGSANFNHDLLLSAIPITIQNNTAYREFRLDINENESNAGDQYISLDEFKLYASSVGDISTTDGIAFHNGNGTAVAVTPLFNLDDAAVLGDEWVALAAGLSTGSGTEDLAVLIPQSIFAGLTPGTFIYLWSVFGEQATSTGFIWNSTGGFEEWHVREPLGISGTKFNDLNADGIKGTSEPGLAGWQIYIDANNNNTFDPGIDFATTTDASGNWSFPSLTPGTYIIRETQQTGWVQSAPSGVDQEFTVTLGNASVSGNDFGNYQPPAIKTGTKYNDLNADGVKDSGEPGLAGWVIYDDANGNGTKDTGEISTTTDASGNYTLTLVAGVHHIREVQQSGWIQSAPDVPGDGDWDVTLTGGQLDTGNDFGNYQNATKTGTKFNDLNANGAKNSGEPGLANWVIYDDANENGSLDGTEASATTDASGNYTLTLKPGIHHIAEVLQSGWTQSYPGDDGDWDITLTSGQVDPGNDFGNYQTATKSGTKFNDLNANGVKDSGEPGLAGWMIYDDANENGSLDVGETSTTTDGSGNYTLTLLAGVHHIREVQQSGWIQSAPDVPGDGDWDVTLTGLQVDTGNDFGNYQTATKSGTKFHDLNANGVKDSGDVGLAGWMIYDDANENGSLDVGETSTTTDGSGNYTLTLLVGAHHISEVQQSGWIQSAPDVPGDGDWDVTLTGLQVDTGNDFGNYHNATKSGTKFNDLNANGVRDSGEPGIEGWGIFAEGIGAFTGASTTTDASGNYTFTLKPGAYEITEEHRSGWIQSYPDKPGDGDWDITLTSGQVDSGNDFGNYQTATKSGTKFNDLNANGVKDSGEPGLAGWMIYDDANENGSLDVGETSTTTDGSGNYTLTLLVGAHHISEVQQSGWIQSAPDVPGDGDWDVTLTGLQVDTGNDFGNYQTATKSGTKFNDLNADGVKDSGEPGLGGWMIYDDANENGSLDVGETSTTTDGSGNYTLTLLVGAHHISEVQQSGWIQSAPDVPGDGDWDVTLTGLQVDTGNDFGNYQNATKTGTKFEDLNGNGVKDSGDPGLSGWVIFDDTNNDGTLDPGEASTATDSSGNYTLSLKPGEHHIAEVLQSGWIQSYPGDDGDWDITLTSGQVDPGNNFGNYLNGSIHGFKFNDSNGNGVFDPGENPLADITIQLVGDVNGDGTTSVSETLTTTTDADGKFSFGDLHPGDYVITELADGTLWGATVNHDGVAGGDTTTTVTVQSGQELVAFEDVDWAGLPLDDPRHEVLADNGGYDVIFGNIALGGCGLSPGFWANHLYVWDGVVDNGPKDGQNVLLADKLTLAGTISQPDLMGTDATPNGGIDPYANLFGTINVDGNDRNAAGQNIGAHFDLVIQGSGSDSIVIQWDDAQQLISGTAIKGGDKLADFTRMTINAYLDNIGVPDYDTPAGLLPAAADWLLANAPKNLWSGDATNHTYILQYNNKTEANTNPPNTFLPQDGSTEGFAVTIKANSGAWTDGGDASGAAIFNDLTAIICVDDEFGGGNLRGAEFQVSTNGSIVILGICDSFDGFVSVLDSTENVFGGYNNLHT